jgi:LPS-assembly lipoprotein
MWSRKPPRTNRPAAVGALAAGLFALGACGFQPMYASQAGPGSGQISPEVPGSVAIAPIPERIGQQLHNALRDRLNPQGQPTDPAYRLKVSIGSVSEPSTLRDDGTATRRNFRLKANWQLDDYARRARLFRSTATATSSYNVVDQPYATMAAFRDAQARAVDQVARDIAARVSGVLAAGPSRAGTNDRE